MYIRELLGIRAGRRTIADSRGVIVIIGIAAAALVHGMFNLFLFAFAPVSIALVVMGIWWTLRRFKLGTTVSPFRYRRNYPRIACPTCDRRISVISRYCHSCGTPHPCTSRRDLLRQLRLSPIAPMQTTAPTAATACCTGLDSFLSCPSTLASVS